MEVVNLCQYNNTSGMAKQQQLFHEHLIHLTTAINGLEYGKVKT